MKSILKITKYIVYRKLLFIIMSMDSGTIIQQPNILVGSGGTSSNLKLCTGKGDITNVKSVVPWQTQVKFFEFNNKTIYTGAYSLKYIHELEDFPNTIKYYMRWEYSIYHNMKLRRDATANGYISFDTLDEFYNWYQMVDRSLHTFYEIVPSILYQKPYFDLDCKKLDDHSYSPVQMKSIINRFIDNIIETFIDLYPSIPLLDVKKDFVICSSNKQTKDGSIYSYHIIVHTYCVKGSGEYKLILSYLNSMLQEKSDMDLLAIFDVTMGKENQAFRLPYMTKLGQDRHIIIDNKEDFHNKSELDLLKLSAITHVKYANALPPINSEVFNNPTEAKTFGTMDETGQVSDNLFHCYTHKHYYQIANLVNLWSIDRSRRYDLWYKGMCLLKNISKGDSLLGLAHDFSQRTDVSGQYDQNECDECWHNIRDDNRLLNINHAKRWSIKDSPDSYYADFKLPKDRPADVIYNEPIVRPYETYLDDPNCRTLIVWAHMDTQKTNQLVRYIKKNPEKRILFVTFRISLCSATLGKLKSEGLDFTDYRGISGDIKKTVSRLVIQFDSVKRISNDNLDWDLVVLDEVNLLIQHFESPLMNSVRSEIFEKFESILNEAHQCVMMDAYITQRVYDFAHGTRGYNGLVITQNKFISPNSPRKTFIYNNWNNWLRQMIADIRFGKQIGIITMSRAMANKCAALIDCIQRLMGKGPKKETKKTDPAKPSFLEIEIEDLYTSETIRFKKDRLVNVNDSWRDSPCVIYTQTITAGLSYDNKSFDSVYAYLTNKTGTWDTALQMLYRIRRCPVMHIVFNIIPQGYPEYDTEKFLTNIQSIQNYHINKYVITKRKKGSPMTLEYPMKDWVYTSFVNNTKHKFVSNNRFKEIVLHKLDELNCNIHFICAKFARLIPTDGLTESLVQRIDEIGEYYEEQKKLAIIHSTTLSMDQIINIEDRFKRYEQITREEHYSLQKAYFQSAYGLPPNFEFDPDLHVAFIDDRVSKRFKDYKIFRLKEDDIQAIIGCTQKVPNIRDIPSIPLTSDVHVIDDDIMSASIDQTTGTVPVIFNMDMPAEEELEANIPKTFTKYTLITQQEVQKRQEELTPEKHEQSSQRIDAGALKVSKLSANTASNPINQIGLYDTYQQLEDIDMSTPEIRKMVQEMELRNLKNYIKHSVDISSLFDHSTDPYDHRNKNIRKITFIYETIQKLGFNINDTNREECTLSRAELEVNLIKIRKHIADNIDNVAVIFGGKLYHRKFIEQMELKSIIQKVNSYIKHLALVIRKVRSHGQANAQYDQFMLKSMHDWSILFQNVKFSQQHLCMMDGVHQV